MGQTVWQKQRVFVVVRTYPYPARQGVEVSCTAGITAAGSWIRLFPVPHRFMNPDNRFRKYQWIDVSTLKAPGDQRVESFKINPNTIAPLREPISSGKAWMDRKAIVMPLRAPSLCSLQREQKQGGPTLGFFKPRTIERLLIIPQSDIWKPSQQARLRQGLQGNLFTSVPDEELEKVPFAFKYRFHCDDDGCRGHALVCTDWEMGQSWRKWSREYGAQWEAKFRERYERDMIERRDTHFYVGTVHRFPNSWIIIGLFYPPRPSATPLFNA